MRLEAKQILDELVKLQNNYASTFRAMITQERYDNLVKSGLIKDYTYDSKFIREPLIEHVGHTPLIASYLHKYIEHTDKVDLGRALIMLSIHDIGETSVGDIMTYKKTKEHEDIELKATKKLLPEYLFSYFQEMEERKTFDAKFAKSVDSIAPLLHEFAMPKVTLERFEQYNFGIDNIINKKKEHFEWDSVLEKFFNI
ncbi:MAG: HD domain-containing protein [Candidatus Komeilibacteria bacterium]|jgi:5'-deoxynucleotidase YfbR-like HD superfamily hydrolase|nr:HD domain-containing protein [Candidatus Komeilibacteria bacterium]MBT4447630.1 HD domain-containing protein [Candidatus Komeilibacteria bacterium]